MILSFIERTAQMAAAITHRDDPDSHEEERLRTRIDSLREEIVVATSELKELRADISSFEVRFDARIGILIVEFDRLSVQIAEYERRIAALTEPVEMWSLVEDEISREFRSEWERIEAEDEDAQQAGQRVAQLPLDPPEDVKLELRKLYRKLVRDHHPDLARTDDERASHEEAMRRINAAYEVHDLEALRRLEIELPENDRAFPGTTISARIAWAAAQIGNLEQALAALRAESTRLRGTDKFKLYEKARSDPCIMHRLEATYKQQVIMQTERRDALVIEYRNLTGLYFSRKDEARG